MKASPRNGRRISFGPRALLLLSAVSCVLVGLNWIFWSVRDIRGVTGGAGGLLGPAVAWLAVLDLWRRPTKLALATMVLAAAAAAYWPLKIWLALRAINA